MSQADNVIFNLKNVKSWPGGQRWWWYKAPPFMGPNVSDEFSNALMLVCLLWNDLTDNDSPAATLLARSSVPGSFGRSVSLFWNDLTENVSPGPSPPHLRMRHLGMAQLFLGPKARVCPFVPHSQTGSTTLPTMCTFEKTGTGQRGIEMTISLSDLWSNIVNTDLLP